MSALDDLLRWNEQIKALPEPIAYIVLDHDMPTFSHIEDRDAQGRRYVRITPAVLDEMRHVKASTSLVSPGLLGIPVYKRENMPEGWPDA